MKKRSDGRYQLSVMIGFRDDGKPKRKLVYGKTQKEVREKSNEVLKQHQMGLPIDKDITVKEWAETWITTYKTGISYNTHKMYSIILNTYLIPNLGNFKLANVKTVHLQKIINDNIDKYRTVEIFKLTVTQIFNQAVLNDLIPKNVALGLNLPKVIKQNKKRALTEEEITKIKNLDLDAMTLCFINLLLYTGIRRGEALALTSNDINFEKKEIYISKTVIFKKNRPEIKLNPKTKSGIRVIPILKPLESILYNYINSINTEYLFTTQQGYIMSETAFRRMFAKFQSCMNTNDITPHIFRHNFATILYNAGVDMKTAQSILGHSSITVTMNIYTHLDEKNNLQAANKLNDYFK